MTTASASYGWLDLRGGASGDMLLGALVDAGVPLDVITSAVTAVSPEPAMLRSERVRRHGLSALRVHVEVPATDRRRSPRDIDELIARADLDEPVRDGARAVFDRLARAEAHVHGTSIGDVHFHEVGALDAIADIVGVIAGFDFLGLDSLSAGEVSIGRGTARGEHGVIPVPGPAVLALLQGIPVSSGPTEHEACTPTGAALVAHLVDDWQPLPSMRPLRTGVGAGGRDTVEFPNVVRLVLGTSAAAPPLPTSGSDSVLIQTNVDDLDPRLWPHVLAQLLAAGAVDAWLTPIIMKKGRPAYTLSVLCDPSVQAAVVHTVFAETSTIGVRTLGVGRLSLDRTSGVVEIDGVPIATKTAWVGGRAITVSVEYDDVAAAAEATSRPARDVLRRAEAAAEAVAEAAGPAGPAGRSAAVRQARP